MGRGESTTRAGAVEAPPGETKPSSSLRARLGPFGRLEDMVLVVAGFLATLHAEWPIVSNRLTFQADATIHEYWMRKFQDSAFFTDPLTDSLLGTGYSPPGFRSLYWLASHEVDPVFFGELLPLVLQPFAVWLVFRIVRAHVTWWPAAWIGAALFLVPWDIHRFSGGHPRAFAQPVVLLTVLLLLYRRNLAAALVPPVGLLLYPPAGVVALAIVCFAAFDRHSRRFLDLGRVRWAAVSVLGAGAALLITRLTTRSQEVITESEAHLFPEFGAGGQMHFFASSTLEYLRQNYSGFFLQDSGSILAVTALLLLILRPRNVMLLRWQVWCMPIAGLLLFVVAHAVLFRLYLPHRYTYALLPFFCIAIAVSLRPSLQALAERSRLLLAAAPALVFGAALLALTVLPLGPRLSLSGFGAWLEDAATYLVVGLVVGLLVAVLAWRRQATKIQFGPAAAASAAAILSASLLVSGVAFADDLRSPAAVTCRDVGLYRELQTLRKDTIIAADPFDADCIPIAARRPVVISRKLYQPWAVDYFELIRERMFTTVAAYYGTSVEPVLELGERHGADYLLVRTRGREPRWGRMEPFTSEVYRLRGTVDEPAIEQLPESCVTWRSRRYELYSLTCLAEQESR